MVGGSASDTNGDATPTTATLDLAKKGQVGWSWEQSPPAQSQHCWPVANPDPANPAGCIGRSHANTVLLPDGTMVTVGGGRGVAAAAPGTNAEDTLFSDPVYAAELWDPATNTWRVGPSQQDARTYHSTALLLPNGSVMSAGDDRPEHQPLAGRTAEIYDPPYMFKGAGPDIAYPRVQTVGYNQPFTVNSAAAANVTHVRLVALGADTHANDMDQREMELAFAPGAGALTATSPAAPTLAPPGYYMMFLQDAQGAVSSAAMVRLDLGAAGPTYVAGPAAPPPAAPAAAPVAGPLPAALGSTSKVSAKAGAKKSVKLTVVRRNGRLVVSFALPKGTFKGNLRLFRVTTVTPKATTHAKAKPKPLTKLTLVSQKRLAKAKGKVSATFLLPKQRGRVPMRFQVKLALTGPAGLTLAGTRALSARGR